MSTIQPKYAQRRHIKTKMVDSEAFIITRTTIKHLNPTATLIWCLIKQPIALEALCEDLNVLLPTIDKIVIKQDALHCLKNFQELGIISTSH